MLRAEANGGIEFILVDVPERHAEVDAVLGIGDGAVDLAPDARNNVAGRECRPEVPPSATPSEGLAVIAVVAVRTALPSRKGVGGDALLCQTDPLQSL